MINYARQAYFSTHHATRDLLGALSPLTAFAALLIAFHDPARTGAATFFREHLANISFWAFVLAVVVYLVGGYFVGIAAAFFANYIHRLLQKLGSWGQTCSYTYWYAQDVDDIHDIYKDIFPNLQYFSSGAAVKPTDKVNILKEYFRKFNGPGYAETYRQFMKVDIVRAMLVYPVAIIGYQAISCVSEWSLAPAISGWRLTLFSLIALFIASRELPRRIRKVVRTEYTFIIASARLRQDAQAS